VVIPIGLDAADIAAVTGSPNLRLPAPWRANKMAGGYVTALLLALALPAAAQDHPPLRHRVVSFRGHSSRPYAGHLFLRHPTTTGYLLGVSSGSNAGAMADPGGDAATRVQALRWSGAGLIG
jgi:hypothetical protein